MTHKNWWHPWLTQGVFVVLPVFSALVLTQLLWSLLKTTPTPLFLMAVMISSWYGGWLSGIFAAGGAVLAINYCLMSTVLPGTAIAPNLVLLGIFVTVALLISQLKRTGLRLDRHQQTEDELRRSLKALSDFKFALDESAIVAVTDQAGRITDVNDKFCDISQFSREELLGQDHRIINSGYHSRDFFRQLWSTIAAGQVWQGEIKNRAKDGSEYWVDTTIVPFLNERGQPFRYLAIRFEVTERKRVEAALKLAQSNLEARVEQRTEELKRVETSLREQTRQMQQSLSLEAMLKRITDKVRDSLDESQILQAVVLELGRELQALCCDTALYDLKAGTSTIYQEYAPAMPSAQGQVIPLANFPEGYRQLLRGQEFQFCSLQLDWQRGDWASLACPISDDQGIIGDLWLFRYREASFSELEVRLVQQVANQCAIALRQARLYQSAQMQVKTLERLHWLKDDFLSTVSHELRTPVSNMKMSIRMLQLVMAGEELTPHQRQKASQYLQILDSECQREISLINDLLDLQRLEAGKRTLDLEAIDVSRWLSGLVQSFKERTQSRQQVLEINLLTQDLPPLISDVASLDRILTELLNNACKYTPPGERIVVRAYTYLDRMQLEVSNSGAEIPSSELPRIFDKFYRIPNADPWKQGGTGLGLTLVKKLAEHLGGMIRVVSTNGQTTFMVELPLRLS